MTAVRSVRAPLNIAIVMIPLPSPLEGGIESLIGPEPPEEPSRHLLLRLARRSLTETIGHTAFGMLMHLRDRHTSPAEVLVAPRLVVR